MDGDKFTVLVGENCEFVQGCAAVKIVQSRIRLMVKHSSFSLLQSATSRCPDSVLRELEASTVVIQGSHDS